MPPHMSEPTLCALPFDHGKLPSAIAPPSCSNYAVMPSERCCSAAWTANAPNPTAGPASASACLAAGAHMTTMALSMPTLVSHLASSYQEQDRAGACGPAPAMHAHHAHQTVPWHSVPTNSVVPLARPNDTALLEQMFGVATPPRFPLPPFRADAYVYTTPASTIMHDFGAYRLAPLAPQLPQQLQQLQCTNPASAAPMQIPMLDHCTQFSQPQTRKRSADVMQGYPSTSYSTAADNVCLLQGYMQKRGRTSGSTGGVQPASSDFLAPTYPSYGSPSTFVAMGNRDHQHQLQQHHHQHQHQHQVAHWARPMSQEVCGSEHIPAMGTQSAPHHWQMVVSHQSQSQQQGQYLGLIPYGAAMSSSLSEPLVLAQTRTPSPLEQRPQMLLQLPVLVKPVCSIHDAISAAFSWLSFKQPSTMSLALHCLSRLDTNGALTHAVPQAWTQRAVVLLWMAAKLEENRFGLAGASRVAACISMLPGDATAMELELLSLLDWAPYKGFKDDDEYVFLL